MEKTNLKAVERFSEIENLVQGDSAAENLLNSLVNSATRYVNFVADSEAEIRNLKNSDNYFKEKETVAMLDNSRRNYHESLISNLKSINRYLFKNYDGKTPVGGVYSLPPESIRDRNAVGDWAGNLIFGLKELH